MRTATRPASLLTAAVLAGCLTASGCIPGVTWTPDSRGFYFTGGKDYQTLYFFDVAARKAKPVVADTGGLTQWPAVSPDGKRVAVVVPAEREGKKQYRVVAYDPEGKEVQRSRPFPLGPQAPGKDAPKSQVPIWLFWAPKGQGDKVLLQMSNSCGVFDLKENRFTDLGDHLLWVFADSPARPDGKGFLALKPALQKGEPFTAAFFDWQGKKRPIDLIDPEGKWNSPASRTASTLQVFPYLFPSRWQDGVATARGGGLELAVDTGKGTATLTQARPERNADARVIRQEYRFGKDGVRVRVVELGDDPKQDVPLRIEVLPPGAAAKVLAEKATLTTLIPSPDGKTLAIRYLAGNPGQATTDRVTVINAQGEVLADLDAMKE
jgi:dipeptidyl aminopeptidase/acylaminoacyl peptidase